MPLRCSLVNDPWHVLSHNGDHRAVSRHDWIRDIIVEWVKKAGGRAWVEPRQVIWHDDRRPDVRVSLGPAVFELDVSVVHPTSASHLAAAVQGSLGAAKKISKAKSNKFGAMSRSEGSTFVPFILETYGGFCKEARDFMKELSKHAGVHSAVYSSSDLICGLRSAIHAALFKGNLQIAVTEIQRAQPSPVSWGSASLLPRAPFRTDY